MRKPELIEYKGHTIIYLNFENLKKAESIKSLETAGGKLIQKHGFKSVLVLTNMRNMFFNNEVRNHFIDVAKANSSFVRASAVIGLRGLLAYMYNDFIKKTGRNIKMCETRKEALKYLVSFATVVDSK